MGLLGRSSSRRIVKVREPLKSYGFDLLGRGPLRLNQSGQLHVDGGGAHFRPKTLSTAGPVSQSTSELLEGLRRRRYHAEMVGQ